MALGTNNLGGRVDLVCSCELGNRDHGRLFGVLNAFGCRLGLKL
jgi:hypothetical protein